MGLTSFLSIKTARYNNPKGGYIDNTNSNTLLLAFEFYDDQGSNLKRQHLKRILKSMYRKLE
jgi:hypothetical protein